MTRPRVAAQCETSWRERELELAQDGADVGLDGAVADPEPRGDPLVGVAAGEVVQDLALARRQRLQLVGGAGAGAEKACRTNAASRGEKHASPAATVATAASSSAVSIVLVT